MKRDRLFQKDFPTPPPSLLLITSIETSRGKKNVGYPGGKRWLGGFLRGLRRKKWEISGNFIARHGKDIDISLGKFNMFSEFVVF